MPYKCLVFYQLFGSPTLIHHNFLVIKLIFMRQKYVKHYAQNFSKNIKKLWFTKTTTQISKIWTCE